ncbi:MAG: chemotaxis protein CheW [Pseudomonadota bacterium]
MAISSLQSIELIERLHAYDGVKVPVVEDQRMRWVGTSLSIAGVPLLVGEGELEEIIEMPPVTPIPGTKAWVLGVAAFKGGLLPILSGDVFFRKRPYTGRVRDYCMVINRAGLHFGMTLSHVQRDLQFPIEDREMNHEVDADFERYTLGGFMSKGEFLAVLDIDILVADEDLTNASATANSTSKG